jgi:hypothetical protein
MVAMAKKIDTSIAFLSEVERGKKPPPQCRAVGDLAGARTSWAGSVFAHRLMVY